MNDPVNPVKGDAVYLLADFSVTQGIFVEVDPIDSSRWLVLFCDIEKIYHVSELYTDEREALEALLLNLKHREIDVNAEYRVVAKKMAAIQDAMCLVKGKLS